MAEDKTSCRTFEEELYWTNFKSLRFFIFLSSDFLSQLMIPKNFSENMRDKLPQMAVFKSPGGGAWKVQLIRDGNNSYFFGDGWKEFAKAHNSKENDVLMFKYNRESCFKVWVFNGKNSCEKAGSNFVRNSALGNSNAGEKSQSKRKKVRESSIDIEPEVNEESSELEGLDTEWTPAGNSRRKPRRHFVCDARNNDAGAKTHYTPNRNPPNAVEKERALQMAIREATNESFIVVIKPSHISQYYRLGIPVPWGRAYLAPKNQDMELHANGKSWTVRLNIERRCGGGVVVAGWYKFVVDNSLQVFDVCLFKLVSQKGEPARFDVLIFRAAPEVADQPPPKPSSVCYF